MQQLLDKLPPEWHATFLPPSERAMREWWVVELRGPYMRDPVINGKGDNAELAMVDALVNLKKITGWAK